MTRAHGFGGQFSVATFGGGALLSVAVLASLVFQFLSPLRAPGACPPVFADEFDSARLDTARWNDTYPTGQAEQQAYVPEALSVSSGMLHISAAARPGDGLPYTSGTITTRGKFSQQYGYFEMRARVPQGQGLWPAFWLHHRSNRRSRLEPPIPAGFRLTLSVTTPGKARSICAF